MKKIVFIGIVFLMILAGCSGSDDGGLEYLSTAQIEAKMNDGDTFVLVVGRDTCSACIDYKPVLQQVVTNKEVTVHYLQIVDGSTGAAIAEMNRINQFRIDVLGDNSGLTPYTFIFEDGVIVDKVAGLISYRELLSWLEQYEVQ